jgi:hypothetical protein
MVETHEFSSDRINTGLERLEAEQQSTQTGLESFS